MIAYLIYTIIFLIIVILVLIIRELKKYIYKLSSKSEEKSKVYFNNLSIGIISGLTVFILTKLEYFFDKSGIFTLSGIINTLIVVLLALSVVAYGLYIHIQN